MGTKQEQGTLETQEQPQNQDVEQTQEQEPTYRLTKNGQIEGDFSDWGLSDEEGEQSKEEEQPSEGEEKPQYYTKEEMQELGLEKLDPKRIPPELVPFYKSMQADYTRKTQALAQERKVIESLLDNALSNPVVAQQLMSDPNFIQTAQQHPQLAQKLQAVSQMAQPQQQKSPVEVIAEQAKKMVEQEFGQEFDPLDERHIAALNLYTQQITQQIAQQEAINQRVAQLMAQEPRFQEVDVYAQQKFASMPMQEAAKILAGGIPAILEFWEQARKEFYANEVQGEKAAGQQSGEANPPPLESAGKGEVQQTKRLNPTELAELDEDGQAAWLIQNGFV